MLLLRLAGTCKPAAHECGCLAGYALNILVVFPWVFCWPCVIWVPWQPVERAKQSMLLCWVGFEGFV